VYHDSDWFFSTGTQMSETTQQPESVQEATGARARLAQVYAQAAYASARKAGLAEAFGDELQQVVTDVLDVNSQVEAFLTSAAFTRKERLPVLAMAFEANTSELFRKFLGVLNQNNRLDLLRPIAASYRKLLDETAGRVRVLVTTALPLTEAQLSGLRETLTTSMSGSPVIEPRVNPDILGGLVVQVGDRVFDTSVRTRLDNLRNHLMTSGTHV
jgi:F-type H+-transporting ATPase subunit delta